MTIQSELDSHYSKGMQSVADRLTESHLERMRTSALGGSSVSLAVILLLLQTDTSSVSFKLALYAAALAIPAWIAAWQYVEAYMFYGKPSYGHFNSVKGSGVAVLFALAAMFLLLVSISSLIWHMSVAASLVFAVSSVLMAIVVYKHHNAVRRYAETADAE